MKTQNYINGEWAASTAAIQNINPSDTADIIGEFAQADNAQLDAAINAAQTAQITWAKTGIETRHAALAAIGKELMAQSKEIGELLSREEGKPRAEGVGEVYRAGQFFDYYAAECLRQLGENADSVRPDIEIDVRREPVGVVAVISPWNFPMATACWKIAPALAFGNAVIWKPAGLTPATATALAEIISRQDMPRGVFNLVMGDGKTIGDSIAKHPKINAISFTGSLATGKNISQAAATHLTKLQMEMGSKNALAIMDDADIDLAVQHATSGAYGGSGQKCTASSRLIVHKKILTPFIKKITEAIRALKVGHALAAKTQIGPVVSEAQLNSNLSYMQLAKDENAELLCGGDALQLAHRGYYMSPALLMGDNKMKINREEMFAPIACIIAADSFEHAVALVNDTEYGLVSGMITCDLARATHFRQQAKTGCVMINLPTAGTDYHVPFGGRKNSSYGPREQGRAAAEFYTTVKTVYSYAGRPR